eukprot:TRINITY_DN61481_c0_g1_i1.p1 TRINITY_DN61481_c0_g1~~TRINITY_DN61481_c0_g1_i1.p1  ORF type:complete len:533 (+),score=88.64 TRINITY_DN61481_c0_g1_i1:187-1785(+)
MDLPAGSSTGKVHALAASAQTVSASATPFRRSSTGPHRACGSPTSGSRAVVGRHRSTSPNRTSEGLTPSPNRARGSPVLATRANTSVVAAVGPAVAQVHRETTPDSTRKCRANCVAAGGVELVSPPTLVRGSMARSLPSGSFKHSRVRPSVGARFRTQNDSTPTSEALEDCVARLTSERSELEAELQCLHVSEPEVATRVQAANAMCAHLAAELDTKRKGIITADARLAETQARRSSTAMSLLSEREALVKEISWQQVRCRKLEATLADMETRLEDACTRQTRGNKETLQLKAELLERQGERISIITEKTKVERTGAQRRLQATSLEAHVTRLAAALEVDDAQFERQSKVMKSIECKLNSDFESERRQRSLVSKEIPRQIEAARVEKQRCDSVTESLRREVAALEEKRTRLQEHAACRNLDVDRLQKERWAITAERGSAAAARKAAQSSVVGAEAEVVRLTELAEYIEEQNLELVKSQVPLRNACSILVEKDVRQLVERYLEEIPCQVDQVYPCSKPPSPRPDESRSSVKAL